MANKIVVGNLKSYMTINEVKDYLEIVNKNINSKKAIICPTEIYIPYFLKQNYSVGIQNISAYDLGAYTGETSAIQAKKMGINYAIIGHSERRQLLSETDNEINIKIKKCLENGIKIILCVGETLDEREEEKTFNVLKNELNKDLKSISREDINKIVIAYEPIWAIGTGRVPTNEEISEVSNFIKDQVNKKFGIDIPVLYGGSVNEKNIDTINTINTINGVLVGGASTRAKELLKIIEVVVNQ